MKVQKNIGLPRAFNQLRALYSLRAPSPILIAVIALQACTPTVKVEPSDKPITINLNVKIEHEIRVKVDKELDSVLSDDSGLF